MPETSATTPKTAAKAKGILTRIKEFFEYPTLKAFSDDWKALDDKSKAQIKDGIENGSLTY